MGDSASASRPPARSNMLRSADESKTSQIVSKRIKEGIGTAACFVAAASLNRKLLGAFLAAALLVHVRLELLHLGQDDETLPFVQQLLHMRVDVPLGGEVDASLDDSEHKEDGAHREREGAGEGGFEVSG